MTKELHWLWLALTASLLAGGSISVYFGQDANWDLKNYHIYNAWAFLEGRMQADLFAAGTQTYFNPLLDLPYYLLAFKWFPSQPAVVAFIMGLPFGLLGFLTFLCAFKVVNDTGIESRYKLPLSVIAAIFGISGSATVSQIGTTFNEIQIASLIVAGVTTTIWGIGDRSRHISLPVILAAGFLFGLAAGLKLTATIYAPAGALAIFAVLSPLKRRILYMAAFSVAWVVAFLVVFGWWGWRLYDLTGNPVFPMFNQIFGSPWVGLRSGMDNRFKPDSIAKAIFYPFYWLHPKSMTVAEPPFADPRFAIGMIAMVGILIKSVLAWLHRRYKHSAWHVSRVLPPSAIFVLVFLTVGYVVWETLFSILRYAISVEVLLGVVILVALLSFERFREGAVSVRTVACVMLLFSGIAAAYTTYPQWGRRTFGEKVLSVQRVVLPDRSLVIVLGAPLAYVAPAIAQDRKDVRFVGITTEALREKGYVLWEKISIRISGHSGPLFVLDRAETRAMRDLMKEFNLVASPSRCQDFFTNIDHQLNLCQLIRRDHNGPPIATFQGQDAGVPLADFRQDLPRSP